MLWMCGKQLPRLVGAGPARKGVGDPFFTSEVRRTPTPSRRAECCLTAMLSGDDMVHLKGEPGTGTPAFCNIHSGRQRAATLRERGPDSPAIRLIMLEGLERFGLHYGEEITDM